MGNPLILTMEKFCRKCGKPLTSKESQKRGYGPKCDEDHNWKETVSVKELLHG